MLIKPKFSLWLTNVTDTKFIRVCGFCRKKRIKQKLTLYEGDGGWSYQRIKKVSFLQIFSLLQFYYISHYFRGCCIPVVVFGGGDLVVDEPCFPLSCGNLISSYILCSLTFSSMLCRIFTLVYRLKIISSGLFICLNLVQPYYLLPFTTHIINYSINEGKNHNFNFNLK